MSKVHLFVQSFVPRDAISNHTRYARDVLQEAGLMGGLYVWESRGTKRGETISYQHCDPSRIGSDDMALYQLSTGSKVADFLLASDMRIAVNYHNITPPSFFADWESYVGEELERGLRQMHDLATRSEMAIAVSHFNEEELKAVGYRNTQVVPILFDTQSFSRESDAKLLQNLEDRKANGESIWLFVGRIAPNKCQHDIIKAFAYFRRVVQPNAHLYLVGGSSSHTYLTALEQFIITAGLQDAVTITGAVSDAELTSYYQGSSVFVCLSEHEGFCVPLLEAFHNEIPIVAFDATAVPETLGDGGLLLTEKSPAMVASAVEAIETNDAVRKVLIENGNRRLKDFDLAKSKSAFLAAIETVVKQ